MAQTSAATSAASAGSQRAPTLAAAALRIFDLSLGEMLWSRRSVFLALVVGGPVIIAVIARIVELFNLPALRVNGTRVGGPFMFGLMIWFLYLRFIVPILGVFYGTALMADEVEDKTITYLFTRPIPRGAVLLGKYLAYLACTILIVLPSVMLVYFLVMPIGGGGLGAIARGFPDLLKDLGLLALGLSVYGAVFAFIGAQLKRPLLVGLFFAFGWEYVVLAVPGYLKKFTVAYYVQALVPHAMPQDSAMSMLQAFFRDAPSVLTSLTALLLMLTAFLWLAARAVERREYVLEQ
jgi:ABC-type transport system involved in multi-copper enzyme maturation permease subunit